MELKSVKRNNIICLVFASILISIISCAGPTVTYKEITKEQMPVEDQQLLDKAIERGKSLVEYDSYCWTASDILLEHKDELDISLLGKFIYSDYKGIPTVYFGKSDDQNKFNIAYIVKWIGNKPVFEKLENTISIPRIDVLAKAIIKFTDRIEFEVYQSKLNYNYYCLPEGDTLLLYAWPGSTNSQYYLCGGYKSAYTPKNDSLIYLDSIHKSVISIKRPLPEYSFFGMRTSSNNSVLSEVDFAQSLIFMKELPEQIILTKKYFFSIKHDRRKKDYSIGITLNTKE